MGVASLAESVAHAPGVWEVSGLRPSADAISYCTVMIVPLEIKHVPIEEALLRIVTGVHKNHIEGQNALFRTSAATLIIRGITTPQGTHLHKPSSKIIIPRFSHSTVVPPLALAGKARICKEYGNPQYYSHFQSWKVSEQVYNDIHSLWYEAM